VLLALLLLLFLVAEEVGCVEMWRVGERRLGEVVRVRSREVIIKLVHPYKSTQEKRGHTFEHEVLLENWRLSDQAGAVEAGQEILLDIMGLRASGLEWGGEVLKPAPVLHLLLYWCAIERVLVREDPAEVDPGALKWGLMYGTHVHALCSERNNVILSIASEFLLHRAIKVGLFKGAEGGLALLVVELAWAFLILRGHLGGAHCVFRGPVEHEGEGLGLRFLNFGLVSVGLAEELEQLLGNQILALIFFVPGNLASIFTSNVRIILYSFQWL